MEEQKTPKLEQQSQAQIPTSQQPAEHFTPVSASPKSEASLYKKLFFGLLAILVIGGISFGAYSMSKNQNLNVEKNKNNTMLDKEKVIITPTQEISPTMPVGDPSFAYIDDKLNMKYKNVIYIDSGEYDPEPAQVSNPDSVEWISLGLVKPEGIDGYDELFTFREISPQRFIYIMRWAFTDKEKNSNWQDFHVYQYDFVKDPFAGGKVQELATFSSKNSGYNFPKIMAGDAVSKDKKYITLNLFGCWNCGGHMPETAIMDLYSGKVKNIGKVSAFNWLEGANYQYKELKEVPCPVDQEMGGPCFEKPENLPFIEGQM